VFDASRRGSIHRCAATAGLRRIPCFDQGRHNDDGGIGVGKRIYQGLRLVEVGLNQLNGLIARRATLTYQPVHLMSVRGKTLGHCRALGAGRPDNYDLHARSSMC
jgi:hypothetical protein